MNRLRRSILLFAPAAAMTFSPALARAQSYPVRPIKVLTGVAAGSSPDGVLRQVAQVLGSSMGQAVIVENRPGANGILALEGLKSSLADGHTIAMVAFSQMSVNPSLIAPMPHDPLQDFAHIGIFWRGPQLLSASAASPVSSLGELLAMAKTRPGQLRYGSAGNGSPGHLFMEQLKLAAGAAMEHIPYKGTAAIVAGLSGEIDLLMDGVSPQIPHIRSGKLKPLAVSGTQRLGVLPDVPTFEELGVAGIGTVWLGFVAPRGTPAAVVGRLNQELRRAVESPEFRGASESLGRLVTPGTPEAMTATIREEIPLWRAIVQRAQIRPE
ncbi:tripartite tricarboxylate transporter substrate binding protein [uncultured Piscinibacter sp.]|uniref:Bug family tripartite tricarboxylate transporter substrate binding protein n=1 Tax=uncultured Piscinibacter sp. TaxID=1131835 RepID=UPI00260EDEEF|nr:tripartite tricarboxylate transporter substrate binding protein [uncultured Piscinibacter sp.]